MNMWTYKVTPKPELNGILKTAKYGRYEYAKLYQDVEEMKLDESMFIKSAEDGLKRSEHLLT